MGNIFNTGFDYTEWRRSMVDGIVTHEDMSKFVDKAGDKAQFNGKSATIL